MKQRPTHCTKCGNGLIEKVVLAKDYTKDSFSGLFRIGYEEFGPDGWRQELTQLICPSYGETRGFFKRPVEHDMLCYEIGDYDYATKVAGSTY